MNKVETVHMSIRNHPVSFSICKSHCLSKAYDNSHLDICLNDGHADHILGLEPQGLQEEHNMCHEADEMVGRSANIIR